MALFLFLFVFFLILTILCFVGQSSAELSAFVLSQNARGLDFNHCQLSASDVIRQLPSHVLSQEHSLVFSRLSILLLHNTGMSNILEWYIKEASRAGIVASLPSLVCLDLSMKFLIFTAIVVADVIFRLFYLCK